MYSSAIFEQTQKKVLELQKHGIKPSKTSVSSGHQAIIC